VGVRCVLGAKGGESMTTITLDRQVVQRALDALTLIQTDVEWELNSPTRKACRKAELELRDALEQPQPPKTNQCGETCERAKLCAICARGLEQPQGEPWRPIETAPKDGTAILLWGLSAGEISGPCKIASVDVGVYCGPGGDYDGFDWYSSLGDAYAVWLKPTHWQPLPPPPGAAATADRTNEIEALLREARDALNGCERGGCIMLWMSLIARIDVALGGKP